MINGVQQLPQPLARLSAHRHHAILTAARGRAEVHLGVHAKHRRLGVCPNRMARRRDIVRVAAAGQHNPSLPQITGTYFNTKSLDFVVGFAKPRRVHKAKRYGGAVKDRLNGVPRGTRYGGDEGA